MSMKEHKGCTEYESLSRRSLMSGATAQAIRSVAPAWVPTVAYATANQPHAQSGTSSDRDILVTIYLRGGADAMSLVAPVGDPDYYVLRPEPGVHVPRPDSTSSNKGLNLDGFFALPRAMQPLLEVYQAGGLAIVHATGSKHETRSHFDAQHFMEVGLSDARLWVGWIGRHLANIGERSANAAIRGIGIGGTLPLIMQGGPKVMSLPHVEDYHLGGDDKTLAKRVAFLEEAYAGAERNLRDAARNTLRTYDLLRGINFQGYQPSGGAQYLEDNELANSLKATAALIKADVGIEAINVDTGGWDTHEFQGIHDGQMYSLMWSLASNMRAFYTDMLAAGRLDRITVVVMSEFGRAARANGSWGFDHGHGGAMLVMGGNVNGGKVYSQWPSLRQDKLWDGRDLQITIDYRDVLAEVVRKRLKSERIRTVFPNYTPAYRNIVRA
jgi:uncharacterized protein (DUF1501 family)